MLVCVFAVKRHVDSVPSCSTNATTICVSSDTLAAAVVVAVAVVAAVAATSTRASCSRASRNST